MHRLRRGSHPVKRHSGRAGEIAQWVNYLSRICVWFPQNSYFNKPGMVIIVIPGMVIIVIPGLGRQRWVDPWSQFSSSLAYLVSFRPIRDLVPKFKADSTWGMMAKVVLCPPQAQAHLQTNTCMSQNQHSHVHLHVHTLLFFLYPFIVFVLPSCWTLGQRKILARTLLSRFSWG